MIIRRLPPPAAFSLVELALAISIVAFSFLALLGLLPAGLQSNRASLRNTLQTHILQSISADVRLTDFQTLQSDAFSLSFPRTYDNEGNVLTNSEHPQVPIYTVQLVSAAAAELPGGSINPDLLTLQFSLLCTSQPDSSREFAISVARREAKHD